MEIIYLIIGIVLGFGIGYLLLRNQSSSRLSDLLSQKNVADEKANNLLSQKQKLEGESTAQQQIILSLTSENSSSKNKLENLDRRL
ncbi:MAG: hypothetical protein LH473_04770, partial [Chitinophagales bacterium]|nr:hypothetical protein [Chitinophagales bacterium]